MNTEIETIRILYSLLESKNITTVKRLDEVLENCSDVTDNVINLHNASIARIDKAEKDIAFKEAKMLAKKSLYAVTKKRRINNIEVTIKQSLIHDAIRTISVINLNNGCVFSGRSKSNSELELLRDIYIDSENVKRDITLFFKLGDTIKVFKSYTSGELYELTKINENSVVFSLGDKKIVVDRLIPTRRVPRKNNIAFSNDSVGKMYCSFINIKCINTNKRDSDLSPSDNEHYFFRKY